MNNVHIRRIFRSQRARWLSCGSALLIVLGTCIIYALARAERGPDWPKNANFNWARELDLTDAISNPENAFTVVGIRYINGELYASCVYRNTDPSQGALVRGVVGSYGRFWPKVTLQVTSESPPRWKRIGKSPNISGETETRAVAPGQSIMVHVDLDLYRALIRKYRYARLVMDTGASGVFELKDLLPPCGKWPPGLDCLPTPAEPELFPIEESESGKEGM